MKKPHYSGYNIFCKGCKTLLFITYQKYKTKRVDKKHFKNFIHLGDKDDIL